MPYNEFVAKFGTKHEDHPTDWDAPGPVELWFFELPWGQRITLEYHLSISSFNIYMEFLELDAVLNYLDLRHCTHYFNHYMIELLKKFHPRFIAGLGKYHLYRQDDNGNIVLMQTYKSLRVAEYYREVFEARGHKQLYWTEVENVN